MSPCLRRASWRSAFVCALGMACGAPASASASPEIHPDRTVTFRLHAPAAQSVELSGQFQAANRPMVRDETGRWSLTVGPISPDLYPYNFVVDGVGVADPRNPERFPNEGFQPSLIDIPGDTPSLHAERDVPRGDVAHVYYRSRTLNRSRPLLVYTPPGYHTGDARYPVLYLVSGTTDTEETWFRAGRVNVILDNLIAEGKARPMIVVMPYGNMMMGTPRPHTPEAADMYRVFNDELIREILPLVESRYRVVADREHRAIAGFSRGGGQSLFTGFNNLDRFAWMGSYAAYLTPAVFEKHFAALASGPEEVNGRLKLLWLGVGTEDFLHKPATEFVDFLNTRGIKHTSLVTGGGHTWMNARHYLTETLQLYFK